MLDINLWSILSITGELWPWPHTQHSQLQKSIGLKNRVEKNGRTDGQTDTTECFTFPANEDGNKTIATVGMADLSVWQPYFYMEAGFQLLIWCTQSVCQFYGRRQWLVGRLYVREWSGPPFSTKNSSGDEIANVNLLTTISHTRRPTLKYRKRDKPKSFNKLDDRLASTAHEVLNFSICYRISTSQLYNISVASRGPSADDFGTNRKLI